MVRHSLWSFPAVLPQRSKLPLLVRMTNRLGTWRCRGQVMCAGAGAPLAARVSTEEFKMRKFEMAAIALLTMTFLFMPSAMAAGMGGRQNVTGTVKDALGRPLADTKLVLQTGDGHILARTRSGQDGNFEFRDVPSGTYAVVANKDGFTTGTSIVAVKSQGVANLDIALQSKTALSLQVATTRINPQPNAISETGNSQYTLTEHNIESLPQGVNTPINEVLLQMPGVVQDDEAQIHVDGEHEDLQWRVYGVMMPMDSF